MVVPVSSLDNPLRQHRSNGKDLRTGGSGKGSGQKGKGKGGDSSVATRLRATESVLTSHERTIKLLVDRSSYVFIARSENVKSELTEMRDWHRSSGRSQQNPATTFPRQRSWLSAGAPLCHSVGVIRCGHCRRHTSRSGSESEISRWKDARGSGA